MNAQKITVEMMKKKLGEQRNFRKRTRENVQYVEEFLSDYERFGLSFPGGQETETMLRAWLATRTEYHAELERLENEMENAVAAQDEEKFKDCLVQIMRATAQLLKIDVSVVR